MDERQDSGQPGSTGSTREFRERIAALDAMLTAAQAREHNLTVELIRQRATVTEYEAKASALGTIAARVTAAEDARRQAEAVATEHRRQLAVARAEAEASRSEAETLRSRREELEAELARVSDELAGAALLRSDAARLEKERNDARARAHTERRLAAEDRIRAAEAELRAAELEGRLRAAERRIGELSDQDQPHPSDGSPQDEQDEPRAPPRPDVIDLTEAEKEAARAEGSSDDREDETPSRDTERPVDVVLEEDNWAASAPPQESRLHRLIHPRRRR
jgi:chromosome segregation ATPase